MGKLNWGMKACGVFLLWAATAAALPAQTFTTLHSFNGTNGSEPYAGLVQGTDGNLYGTTKQGGANTDGIVFNITTSGMLTSLYSFCKQRGCTDGADPEAGLVQGTNGDFYGTTFLGGANHACGGNPCGTVYKITSSGHLTTLHSFDGMDGETPSASLVLGTNGKFYGTTYEGGANNDGTVFSITAGGTLATLHSFDDTDGAIPEAGLVQGTNGKFYGTTPGGGANGDGTVFSITTGGTLATLHSFGIGGDGEFPLAGLVQASNGNLYGTTYEGGTYGGGTVFRVTPSGNLKTLYSFCQHSGCPDGQSPEAGLVQGTDGNLYGTTYEGGANTNSSCSNGCGTIFSITPSGTLTTLYNFCSQGGSNCTDGYGLQAALVQDTNGTFYGTTVFGGANDDGTVFSLSVGLGPFVKTQPTSGAVGAAVKILGTDLTGATSVSFNGTAATFTGVSASEITTTVPTGATTGTVQVVTPGVTLSSNVPFTVN
jgi:uncharacterized repeat protein (TIGR03803 family)